MSHADAACGVITISIGVESLVPEPGQSAANLVEAADLALYDAKRRGRNTVVAYSPPALRAAS
jgi:diguanylate cyclase (GGDEF)-like protein